MRCRFCDTEIADKALICYRCGKPTADPKVAPPPLRQKRPWPALAGLTAAGAAIAAALPTLLDGMALAGGWAADAVAVAVVAVLVWRRAGRSR